MNVAPTSRSTPQGAPSFSASFVEKGGKAMSLFSCRINSPQREMPQGSCLCRLCMRVVFDRPRHHQATVLPPVNVPAAPVRFMNLTDWRRNQIFVGNLSIKINLLFPGFDALESLLRVAKPFHIIPAEWLDCRELAGKKNNRHERRARLLIHVLWRAMILAGVRPRFVAMTVKLFSTLLEGSTVIRIQGLSEWTTA